jgi:hypothetical protein
MIWGKPDVSEEYIASIFRVEEQAKRETSRSTMLSQADDHLGVLALKLTELKRSA